MMLGGTNQPGYKNRGTTDDTAITGIFAIFDATWL